MTTDFTLKDKRYHQAMSGVRGHVRGLRPCQGFEAMSGFETMSERLKTMSERFFGLTGHVRVRGHVREVETMSENTLACR
jgi:DNA-binding FrmR family transcriptional regulator